MMFPNLGIPPSMVIYLFFLSDLGFKICATLKLAVGNENLIVP